MNLIKALNGLSAPEGNAESNVPQYEKPAEPQFPSRPVPAEPQLNVMASVLERHEQIANRVRNKK